MLYRYVVLALMIVSSGISAVYGYNIISGSQKMVALFARWNIGAAGMGYLGSFIAVSIVFISFLETHILGNLMMVSGYTFLINLRLRSCDLKGVSGDLLLLLIQVLLIFLPFPLMFTLNVSSCFIKVLSLIKKDSIIDWLIYSFYNFKKGQNQVVNFLYILIINES